MARSRRTWLQMRGEIRRLLREDTSVVAEDDSYWSNALLVDCWNRAMDFRVMELEEAHEGAMTTRFFADLVGSQHEYEMPEGTDRIKRVLLRFSEGSTVREVPLVRNERWSQPSSNIPGVATSSGGTLPSYRLVGELVWLDPAPSESRTAGLVVEMEGPPLRFDGTETQKLDRKFPSLAETLLVYDTALEALAVEDAQGQPSGGRGFSDLEVPRAKYEKLWRDWIETRSYGRTYAEAFWIGD